MKNFIFLAIVTIFMLSPIKSEADYSKLDEVAPPYLFLFETSLKSQLSKKDLPDVSQESWERVALSGDANQKKGIAGLFLTGVGVKQNYRKAFKWFSRSAKLGDPTSQLYISLMYSTGKGVKQDSLLAREWLQTCVSAGYESCVILRNASK